MADTITKCNKILNDDSSVQQWELTYQVEDSGKKNEFCIVVKAADLTDPTSASEAKTKANIKAKVVKDTWLELNHPSAVNINSNEGSVTL